MTGKEFKEKREKAGLSYTAMARRLGVSYGAIRYAEGRWFDIEIGSPRVLLAIQEHPDAFNMYDESRDGRRMNASNCSPGPAQRARIIELLEGILGAIERGGSR